MPTTRGSRVTALAMMLAMFLSGVHGFRHRIGIALLGLLSLVWFTVDRLFEGEVIAQVSRNHGIVVSDLIGLLGLIVTGVLWFRSVRLAQLRHHRRNPGISPSHDASRSGHVRAPVP